MRTFLAFCLAASPLQAAQTVRTAVPVAAPAPAAALGLPASSLTSPTLPSAAALPSDFASAPSAPDPVARITGAVTRAHADPGPIARMWFVYGSEEEKGRYDDILARVREENPGVEIVFHRADELLKGVQPDLSFDEAGARAMFERILRDKAEFVLASDHDLYESFRSLRDSGFARELPFGFAGRRFATVDIPRRSLDPGRLSDPRLLPHRRYLVVSEHAPQAADAAGMTGSAARLSAVLAAAEAAEKPARGPASLRERVNAMGQSLAVRLSGQADDAATARLRRRAQLLAAYLEREEIDVLVTDDPAVSRLAAQMKREGYHVGMPVAWSGPAAPADAEGLNLALEPAAWLQGSPHVRLAASASLPRALAEAAALERLPGNFAETGGVPVRDYEAAVSRAMESPAAGEIVFLLSSGNGLKKKGDANAWGHFGMAVKDEQGMHRVWTVHYNDRRGGSFSGGLGEGQMTLGEYLYGLHYHPGANGQAYPLAETSVGPVLAFVLRGVDEAALETMREMAAFVNATHLAGDDRYSFLNKGMLTNCISLVTKILRAAGFAVAESGTQSPGDKAVELIRGFARRLLENRVAAGEADLLVFERPPHAASAYRIPNVTLGSVYLNFQKPWKEMGWRERLKTLLRRPFEFFSVPSHIAAFSTMASRRVVLAGPLSRELRIVDDPASPFALLARSAETVRRLREERVPLMEERRRLEARLLDLMGLSGWQQNPGQDLSELAAGDRRALPPAEEAELQAGLSRHHALDVAVTLNRFDELLELRRESFLKIRLADPTRRYARRLGALEAAAVRVLARREEIARTARMPTAAEIEALHALNASVEAELNALRAALLADLGDPPALDIRTVFRGQVTRDLLTTLRGEAVPGEAKGKEGK